ncbi:DUF3862 domain-containing protein [Companilactobacillus huachuanensis]|uniref:DUF3862 domain-containing protein n=1 Tax=Companilactobacillus huachuanensis TaxID=2559914 RepID=A0ABW1RJD7_9LACO|nr:DUF3862 domain-containing protein [Companilactobacillus huachuanensis]
MDYNNNLPTRSEYRRSLKHKKKHFYKSWWFWTIVVVLILAGSGVAGMKMTSTGPFHQTSKVSKSKKTKKKSTSKKTDVTFAQYSGIFLNESSGTPIATVQRLLGKPSSTSTSTANNAKTEINTWNNIENGDLGSNLTVNFVNGHAISKAISGLKVVRSEKLGLDAYSSVQNGMQEDTILTNVGKPNGYSESFNSDKTSKSYTYSSGVSGNTGANFVVNFTNGTVSGKSQTGMK